MKELFGGIVGLVLLILLGFVLSLAGYESYKFFAPRYTAVDNQVFHESQLYNDGMVRDLENLQMAYLDADQEHKDALRAITLHRFSVYPEDKMPANLRNFYEQLKAGK